jgi:hypothetical protein
MNALRLALFSLVIGVFPAQAQMCPLDPMDNPNGYCGGLASGPVLNCGSSDPNYSPSRIETHYVDLNGPPLMPGDFYALVVRVHDLATGQWYALDIDLCLKEGLDSKVQYVDLLRNFCSGQLGEVVQNYSTADRLFVRHLYADGTPCESPATVQAMFQVKPTTPVGSPVHHTVLLRSRQHPLFSGRLDSEIDFTVGQLLPPTGD